MLRQFTVIIVLFLSVFSYGKEIRFEHYNDEMGLSHNSVRHIVQDEFGFLWLGTFGGLNRFDGYNFKSYLSTASNENTLNNDDITALELDKDSNQLWIGTRNGLSVYNLKTHQFHTFLPEEGNPLSIPDSEIRALHIDKFNRIWIGTKNKGLCFYDPIVNKFVKIKLDNVKYIKSIIEDSSGNIWIGSYLERGVSKIVLTKEGKLSDVHYYDIEVPNVSEKNPYLYFLFEDDKLDLFAGTRRGIYKLNKESDKFDLLPIKDNSVRDLLPYFLSIAKGPNGNYWLGTLGGLLECSKIEDITTGNFNWYYSELSDETSLVDNQIFVLFFDKSGVLWVGTENGLDKFDPFRNQFKIKKKISDLLESQVPRICGFAKTYDENLIVATNDNGLFLSKNDRFFQINIPTNEISSIFTTDGKIFYCGLWNGKVLVYNYQINRSQIIDIGFNSVPIFAFNKLTSGNILVGSFGQGAIEFDPKSNSIIPTTNRLLEGFEINSIESNRHGIIWFATQSGVVKYNKNTGSLKTYASTKKKDSGLSNNSVKDILIDIKGKLWVTSRLGLDYYDPLADDFMPIKTPKELNKNWITDIVSNSKGELWLNFNNNRVARFNTASQKLEIYHVNNGNRLDIYSNRGFYMDNDSLIYLSGKNGIIRFAPDDLKNDSISLPPFITDIRIQNKEISVNQEINGQVILKEDINISKEIRLAYENRNFSFVFSSPSYVNMRFNQFKYKLEGFDNDWIFVNSGERNIQYTNLFYGKYKLLLKSANSHGIWSEVSSYSIVIEPPIWLSYKAIILYIIVLLLLVYATRRIMKRQMFLRNQLILEKVKRENDEKLNNEKLKFFTNISHELRTPLTLILGPTKQLMQEECGTDYQKSRINLIQQNTNRLLYLVNQILDFRKAESGELKLKVSKTDILSLSKNVFESFKNMAADKNICFELECDCSELEGWIDRDKYDTILYNLLSNALKFTPQKGYVQLKLAVLLDGILYMHVKDNGVGIAEESQQKIFSRFYQIDNALEDNTGSGIGLSLVQSLVIIHKGRLKVQSKKGEGSVFICEIPIAKNQFKQDELFDYQLIDRAIEKGEDFNSIKKTQSTHLKEKILVVEDNQSLRKFLVEYMSDYYKVYEAENGEEGLKICDEVKPVVCISDIMMPIMDGFTFCANLKKNEQISHIPVILLTALTDSENKIKGYKLGADDYMEKPFDPSLLHSRIENIIHSRQLLKKKFSDDSDIDVNLLTHSPVDEEFMQTVTNTIEFNIQDADLSVGFLCEEIGMSSSKLYRKIKELTDLSPNEFIRTIRLKKSIGILKSKKYNVSEVSDLVGFNDPLYFSRCFKKQFGYPPSKILK